MPSQDSIKHIPLSRQWERNTPHVLAQQHAAESFRYLKHAGQYRHSGMKDVVSNTGSLCQQVQLQLNVGPSGGNVWSFKTGGLSLQWSRDMSYCTGAVTGHNE